MFFKRAGVSFRRDHVMYAVGETMILSWLIGYISAWGPRSENRKQKIENIDKRQVHLCESSTPGKKRSRKYRVHTHRPHFHSILPKHVGKKKIRVLLILILIARYNNGILIFIFRAPPNASRVAHRASETKGQPLEHGGTRNTWFQSPCMWPWPLPSSFVELWSGTCH